jgi:Glycosyl hydrolase family 9/Ca-dependent carbohydrate-binding module xylan-binding
MKKNNTPSHLKTLAFALGCSTILAAPSMLEASSLNAFKNAPENQTAVRGMIANDTDVDAIVPNQDPDLMTITTSTSEDEDVAGVDPMPDTLANESAMPVGEEDPANLEDVPGDVMPDSPANESMPVSTPVSDEEMEDLSSDMRTITLEVSSEGEDDSPVPFQVLFNGEVIGEAEATPAVDGANQRVSFEVPESSIDTTKGLFDFGSDVKQELTIKREDDSEEYALLVHGIDADGKQIDKVSGDGALIVDNNSEISTSFKFPERTVPENNFTSMPDKNKVTISASSDRFKGAPMMTLSVNGDEKGRVKVRPEQGEGVVGSEEGAVRDYSFEVEGDIDSMEIGFINDAYESEGKDRNLFIHDVKINDTPVSEMEGITGVLNGRLEDGPIAMFENGSIPMDIEKYKEDIAPEEEEEVEEEEEDDTEVSNEGETAPEEEEEEVEEEEEETPPTGTTPPTDEEPEAAFDPSDPESVVEFITNLINQIVNSILSAIFGIESTPPATTPPATTPPTGQTTQGGQTPAPSTGGGTTTPPSSGGQSPTTGGGTTPPTGGSGATPPAGGGSTAPSTGGGTKTPSTGGSGGGAATPPAAGGGTTNGTAEVDGKTPNATGGSQSANGNGSGSNSGGSGATPAETPSDEDAAENNGVDAGDIDDVEEIDMNEVDTDSLETDFGQFNEGDYDAGNCSDEKVIEGVTSPFNSGDYCEALEKGLFFFYANRSGSAEGNPIEWRDDTDMEDGSDNGVDLTGGWYDAGDAIKFDLPAATSASMMAWSGIKFFDGYKQNGLLAELKKHLAWANDYFMRGYDSKGNEDPADDMLFVQVGDGSLHQFMGRPEDSTLERKSYFVSEGTPATEVAAEKAAAFTSFALLLQMDGDYDSSDALLTAAKNIYDYAYEYQGKYSDSVPEASPYYTSVSGFKDELAWGAAWLYKATGDPAYLAKAEENYEPVGYGVSFDEKKLMTMSLMYDLTGEESYANDLLKAMDEYKNGQNGVAVLPGTDTNGGLNVRQDWGSCNMTMGLAQSVVALAKSMVEREANDERMTDMLNWASDQADYCLGDNPEKFSYMVGFGENFPASPHHRGANNRRGVDPAQYELTGAMVAGPKKSGEYNDTFMDWVTNEVGTSYNAPMVGTLAGLYEFAVGGAQAADDESRDGVSGAGVSGLGIDRSQFGNQKDLSKAETPNRNFNPEQTGGTSSGGTGGTAGGGTAGGGTVGGTSGGGNSGGGVGESEVSGGEVQGSPTESFAPTPSIPGTIEGSAGPVAKSKAPASVISMCGGLLNGDGNGTPLMNPGQGHQTPEMGKFLNAHDVWEGATSVGIDAQGFFDSFTSNNGNYNPGQTSEQKCLGALTVLNEMAAITTMGGLSGDHGGDTELVMGAATNAAFAGDAAGIRSALEGNGGDTSAVEDDLLVSMWSTNSHYYNHPILNTTLGSFKITHLRSLNDNSGDANPKSTRGAYNDKGAWPEWEMYTKGAQFLSENAAYLP